MAAGGVAAEWLYRIASWLKLSQVTSRRGVDAIDWFRGHRPVEPSRLADEVVDQIGQIILDRNLTEGTQLPSERLLAQQLCASRPIVSQALPTQSMMGLVEIKPGS
jgi:hypothetical protein